MTRAQTVMGLLGSLHTLQLDSAWMMRLPVARKHPSGYCSSATCSSVSVWLTGTAGGPWGDRETILLELLD